MEIPQIKDPDLLTDEEIEALLPHLDGLVKWAKQVSDYALQQALAGKEYKGYKVVEGRSLRTFTDEDKVVAALKAAGYPEEVIYERRLLTLTSLETLCGKKKFANILGEFVVKPTGKPALVPETDKRPVYSPNSAADDFSDDPPVDF